LTSVVQVVTVDRLSSQPVQDLVLEIAEGPPSRKPVGRQDALPRQLADVVKVQAEQACDLRGVQHCREVMV